MSRKDVAKAVVFGALAATSAGMGVRDYMEVINEHTQGSAQAERAGQELFGAAAGAYVTYNNARKASEGEEDEEN